MPPGHAPGACPGALPPGPRFAMFRRMEATIPITVNGEPRQIPGPATVADLLAQIGLDLRKVAVERNLEIVPRSTLGEVRVEDGDDYEIVTFVGGG